MRRFVLALVGSAALMLAAGDVRGADEVPTPSGTSLRGAVETDGIREVPELKAARENRMRDESVSGVKVLDQTFDTTVAYREAVRFYDEAFASATVLERDEANTATGWLVRHDDGAVVSVVVRNTQPTTIEVQKMIP